MVPVLIVFLVAAALVNLAIGYVLGWYRVIGGLPAWTIKLLGISESAFDSLAANNTIRSVEFLARLRELATNVQDMTGQHSTRLGEFAELLNAQAAEGNDPASVLAVATEIVKANRQLEEELASTKLEIEEQQRQLESTTAAARTDALTGILNRRAFDEELNAQYNAFRRQATPVSMLLIDVDRFKQFNDEHGHPAGDAVLRGVASALAQTVRESDIVARYGGEEFCALLPATTLEEAQLTAERLRLAIAEAEFAFGETSFRVTASVGVAALLENDAADTLVKRSDMALYEAKRNGRNCSYYHDGVQVLPVKAAPQGQERLFCSVQRIAPYTDGRLPNASKFREVECQELSAAGFSFLSAHKPNYQQVAVAFGTPDDPFYRMAVVKESVESGTANQPMFRVVCAFADQSADVGPEPSAPLVATDDSGTEQQPALI